MTEKFIFIAGLIVFSYYHAEKRIWIKRVQGSCVMYHKEMKDKIWKYIKVFTALYWGAILEGLESYYIPYLIVLMSGSVCFIFNY